jgi:hypothetical protein
MCPGWLQTVILLISASWVAKITGVSHQPPLNKIISKLVNFTISLNVSRMVWNIAKSIDIDWEEHQVRVAIGSRRSQKCALNKGCLMWVLMGKALAIKRWKIKNTMWIKSCSENPKKYRKVEMFTVDKGVTRN